ncbi:MFS transporter, partial [Ruania albidiflava]|uniref:MFS transporter n=1 Tax=Ruania albidiflava TaxID=366586 RepID=UPI0023F00461
PMMGGLLVASVVSGQMVSRSGRYKAFPLTGSVVMAIGLVLISTVTVETSLVVLCAYICLFGIGIGMSMQILTLIVQNTFPNAIVGTATAANNYFRQVGATLGSAVVGSVFASRLTSELVAKFTAAGGVPEGTTIDSLTPAGVNALPEEVRTVIVHAYNHALMPIFAFLIPLAVVALVALVFLKEVPLATSVAAEESARQAAD